MQRKSNSVIVLWFFRQREKYWKNLWFELDIALLYIRETFLSLTLQNEIEF
jgi:hypothetical protein